MLTSDPTILFVDDKKVIETNAVDEESLRHNPVTLSQGDHRVMIRYLKKGYFSTIWLVWQTSSGERSVIPLRLVRPFARGIHPIAGSPPAPADAVRQAETRG